MEVKNTLLVISVVLVIVLAAVASGFFFYFSLQGESMDRAIALEERRIKNCNREQAEASGRMKSLTDQLDVQDKDEQGNTIPGGLRKRLEEQKDLLKVQEDRLKDVRGDRTTEREKIRPADEQMMDEWRRLKEKTGKKQGEINDEYDKFQGRYDEKLTQLNDVRGELVREMEKRADPELIRMLDEARAIED